MGPAKYAWPLHFIIIIALVGFSFVAWPGVNASNTKVKGLAKIWLMVFGIWFDILQKLSSGIDCFIGRRSGVVMPIFSVSGVTWSFLL